MSLTLYDFKECVGVADNGTAVMIPAGRWKVAEADTVTVWPTFVVRDRNLDTETAEPGSIQLSSFSFKSLKKTGAASFYSRLPDDVDVPGGGGT